MQNSIVPPKKVFYRCRLRMKRFIPVAMSVLLSFCFCTLHAQNIQVKGQVLNDSGGVVPGASVMVKGSSAGVSANQNGDFQISAPGNATLVVSSIGYLTKEVAVNNQTNLSVTLAGSASSMQEVVVIGYGTQRKEAVTGSVASISGEKMREIPAANVSQSLQGRLAGVQMSQTSTQPGATMQIRIRGTRSLTADNNPLIVLDGIPFPGSIADLNPNDIRSVDVLKDASATAIYGSRGANGVILITTNKGQRGGKPRISYNGYYGNQTVFAKYPMMNSQEFTTLKQVANKFPGLGTDEDSSGNTNTDWQDLLYQTGTVNSHDVSVSGGSETGNYTVGMGYYQNKSVIPTQQYTRYSFRTSIDQQVGNYFRVGFNSNSNFNKSEGSQVGIFGSLALSPIANPYNEDGTLKRTVNTTLGDNYVLTKEVVDSL